MKYIYVQEALEECRVTIAFGRYVKDGQCYYAVPETFEDLKQILKFESEIDFKNVSLFTFDPIEQQNVRNEL